MDRFFNIRKDFLILEIQFVISFFNIRKYSFLSILACHNINCQNYTSYERIIALKHVIAQVILISVLKCVYEIHLWNRTIKLT